MKNEKSTRRISPVSVDFGAKTSGVYYADYPEGAKLDEMDKRGEVLDYDKYTVLLKERTANRHARRGYKRRRMAKRLLRLVLQNHFNFPADKHPQALGYLLNRRGYNRMEDALEPEYLEEFPPKAAAELRDVAPQLLGDDDRPSTLILDDLAKKGLTEIAPIVTALEEQIKPVKRELACYTRMADIQSVLQDAQALQDPQTKADKDRAKRLEGMSAWMLEKMLDAGIRGLPAIKDRKSLDMHKYLLDASQGTRDSLMESLPDITDARKRAKDSIWNFQLGDFALEKQQAKLDDPDHKGHSRAHLHHFCHALWKMKDEMESGHRHRREYIKEIKETVAGLNSRPEKHLKEFAGAVSQCQNLDNKKLCHLVAHLSNLELKPLRAYFNGTEHKQKDQWQPDRLAQIASKWFMKQWRISAEADGPGKVDEYNKLRAQWKGWQNKRDIIGFWMQADPHLTIPPYQDMANRHPPRCQSLLLNPETMDKSYPQWRDWLGQLERKQDYRRKLADQMPNMIGEHNKSPRENADVRAKHLDLRVLQFLLDASKGSDPCKLNTIWSHYHKARQQHRDGKDSTAAEEAMRKAIKQSKMPKDLQSHLSQADLARGFAGQSFGHFINAYYKARRKARDGRYFLHQGKGADGKLFGICPHKPRHKSRQWQTDLAAVFGVAHDHLMEVAGGGEDPQIQKWIKELGIESHCRNCTKAQKDYRGGLRIRIESAVYRAGLKSGKRNPPSKDDKHLLGLHTRSRQYAAEIAERLWPDIPADESKLRTERFNSVFSFAQIDNIALRERNGFSNTCPLCSLDNSERMRTDGGPGKLRALASRIPALSVRLIDGAVMRICKILSSHIARQKWDHVIQPALDSGARVLVPLIMEQNRFEFEPSLSRLKGRKPKGDSKDDRDDIFQEKEQRIMQAGGRICPYAGGGIGPDGEIDHIIPRKSEYGTLNDEANLIYASNAGNAQHHNRQYSLVDLSADYKHKMFPDKTDDAIGTWIHNMLEDDSTGEDSFSFGPYRNFINLSADQQKAFRHALFLPQSDPLRDKVIRAINNRNRAIVNGTQRYLAQCIADRLHAMSKRAGFERRLEFDYFEYSAMPNAPRSVYDLRRYYASAVVPGTDGECVQSYDKQDGDRQQPYSHLIDAQMAFLLAAEDHQGDGSMALQLPEDGIFSHRAFTDSSINPFSSDFQRVPLSRSKSQDGVRTHRAFTRGTFYGLHYLPLLIGMDADRLAIRAGFSWQKSCDIGRRIPKDLLDRMVCFAKNADDWQPSQSDCRTVYDKLLDMQKPKNGVVRLVWDKQRIEEHLVSRMSSAQLAEGADDDVAKCFLDTLSYRTERKRIIVDDGELKTPAQPKNISVESILQNPKNWRINVAGIGEIELPTKSDWERLIERFRENCRKHDAHRALRECFPTEAVHRHKHRRARKVFSLPVITGEGKILLRRSSWTGRPIYQVINDSDSRKDDNKPSRPVMVDNDLHIALNRPFNSPRQVIVSKTARRELSFRQDARPVPEGWFVLLPPRDDDLPGGISQIWIKIENKTRPLVRIELSPEYNPREHAADILQGQYTKAKNQDDLILFLMRNEYTRSYDSDMLASLVRVAYPKQEDDARDERVAALEDKIRGSIGDARKYEYMASGFNRAIKGKLQSIFRQAHPGR